MLAVLAATAALAPSATLGLEGTELVYRGAGSAEDTFQLEERKGTLVVGGLEGSEPRIAPGPGCTRVRREVHCPVAGVSGFRLLTGGGDDIVQAQLTTLPAVVDMGVGDDDFDGIAPALTVSTGEGTDRVGFYANAGAVDLGPGEDSVEVVLEDTFTGPLAVEAGDGRDTLLVSGTAKPGIRLSGGGGDDEVYAQTTGAGMDVVCGAGADSTSLRLEDRPGEGCAAHVAGVTPDSVSRAFAEGTLTAPARVDVLVLGRGRSHGSIARGRVTAAAGAPLATRLRTTAAGRRTLRRTPRPRVTVQLRLRIGADRSEVEFNSRLR